MKAFKAMMPSIKELITEKAYDDTLNYFVDNDPTNDGKHWSVIYDLIEEYSVKLKSGDSEMVAYEDNLVKEMLTDVSEKPMINVLSDSILELLPKYMEWRKTHSKDMENVEED